MKIFFKILSWAVMTVFVSLAVALVGLRFCGFTPYAVVSGSMEPTYKTGSIVFVKDIPVKNIQTGDTISFVLDEDLTVATHRVISISDNGEYFYTKGDANKTADPSPVYYKNIIGKVSFSIPLLGYFSIWATSIYGQIFFGCLIFGLVAAIVVRKISKYRAANHTQTVSA